MEGQATTNSNCFSIFDACKTMFWKETHLHELVMKNLLLPNTKGALCSVGDICQCTISMIKFKPIIRQHEKCIFLMHWCIYCK